MSRKVVTVRMERATWVKLHAAAKQRHLTPSGVALLAVEQWLEVEGAVLRATTYQLVKDLIGSANDGDALRSTRPLRRPATPTAVERYPGGALLRKGTKHPVDRAFGRLRLGASVDVALDNMRGPRPATRGAKRRVR